MPYFKLLSKFSVKFKNSLTHNLARGIELLSNNIQGRKAYKIKCYNFKVVTLKGCDPIIKLDIFVFMLLSSFLIQIVGTN